MIPETEYSSSRRLVIPVAFGKRSSCPAWSMWWWVWRIQRTSSIFRPCPASWFSIFISSVMNPVIPRRCMISAFIGPEEQVAPGLHARDLPHVAGEDEEARLELDVDQVEQLDLVGHGTSLPEG